MMNQFELNWRFNSDISDFKIFMKIHENDSKVSTRDAVEKQADRRAIKIFNILSELKF